MCLDFWIDRLREHACNVFLHVKSIDRRLYGQTYSIHGVLTNSYLRRKVQTRHNLFASNHKTIRCFSGSEHDRSLHFDTKYTSLWPDKTRLRVRGLQTQFWKCQDLWPIPSCLNTDFFLIHHLSLIIIFIIVVVQMCSKAIFQALAKHEKLMGLQRVLSRKVRTRQSRSFFTFNNQFSQCFVEINRNDSIHCKNDKC